MSLLATLALLAALVPVPGSAARQGQGAGPEQAGDQALADDGTPPPVARHCFNLDLSTGTTTPFTPDAFGTVDPDWLLTASPDPLLTAPGPVYSIDPVAPWFTTTGANWVDPYNTGYGGGQTPNYDVVGDYVFANPFSLNGTLYDNFQLMLDLYAADNQGELFLDGVSAGPSAGFGPPLSNAVGGPVTVPLGPGTHTLEARVYNASAWMGLLVKGRVTADCRPDVTISKKPLTTMVAGQNGSYQLVVSNTGLGPTTGVITVTDTLPGTFVTAAGSGWTCSNAGNTVTCQHPGPLGAGQSLPPITVTMAVPFGVTGVANCASVETPRDINAQNNRDCVKDEVIQPQPGAVCGIKFHDVNGNGIKDAGEAGLGGWTIQLTDAAGNVIGTVVTGPDGTYCFKKIKPGAYTLSEVMQPGWVQSYPTAPGTWSVTVGSGQVVGQIDFGNRKPKPKPCCLTFRFQVGVSDKFSAANGAEPASPSAGVQAMLANSNLTGFDEPGVDRYFAHTFVLPQGNCISRARLTVRAKPNGSLVYNDTINLRFTGITGAPVSGTPVWGAYFGSGNPGAALLPNPWSSYGPTTFNLDLSNLPGPVNMISALNAQRFLDVLVQDDTAIDYLVLNVEFCECGPAKGGGADPTAAAEVDLFTMDGGE